MNRKAVIICISISLVTAMFGVMIGIALVKPRSLVIPNGFPTNPTVYYTVNTPLTSYDGYTGEQIDLALKGTALYGLGNYFAYFGYLNNIPSIYLAAHAALESGWGTSIIYKLKHNLYGFGAFDRDPFWFAHGYSSDAESIAEAAWYVRTAYLTPNGAHYNGPTLAGMNVAYATDKSWGTSIASIMNSLRGRIGTADMTTAEAQGWYLSREYSFGNAPKLLDMLTIGQTLRDLYKIHLSLGGKAYACAGVWAQETNIYNGNEWNKPISRYGIEGIWERMWQLNFSTPVPYLGVIDGRTDTIGKYWCVLYERAYHAALHMAVSVK